MKVIHWQPFDPSVVRYIVQFAPVQGEIEMWYVVRLLSSGYDTPVVAVWKIKPRIND